LMTCYLSEWDTFTAKETVRALYFNRV